MPHYIRAQNAKVRYAHSRGSDETLRNAAFWNSVLPKQLECVCPGSAHGWYPARKQSYASESVSGPRFTTALLFVFACLAMLLGLIGVYGVMSCRIRWQLRELAVRQALGVQQKDVIWHVIRQGFAIILPGVFIGLLGAIWLNRLLSSMLYEVPVHDPLTFATVSAGLADDSILADFRFRRELVNDMPQAGGLSNLVYFTCPSAPFPRFHRPRG